MLFRMPTLESEAAPAAYMTVDEVAARLRVSRQTVIAQIRRGALPALRIGQQWRIDAADIDGLRVQVTGR